MDGGVMVEVGGWGGDGGGGWMGGVMVEVGG